MKTAIVVSLEGEKFNAVEIATKNNAVEFVRAICHDFREGETTAAAIKAIWADAGFSDSRVIAMIPHDLIQYKPVTMPPLPEEQLLAAARMEMEHNGSAATFLCRLIHSQAKDNMVQAKLAIIPDNGLTEHLNLLQQAGLQVSWFGLPLSGCRHFINFHRDLWDDATTAVFLEIAALKNEICVMHGNEILFCREFGPGISEFLRDSGVWANDVCQEIRLSLAAFQKLNLNYSWPETVWGFGSSTMLAPLAAVLPQTVSLNLNIPQEISLTGVHPGQSTPELAPLIGLALEGIGWAETETSGRADPERFKIQCRVQEKNRLKRTQWHNITLYFLAILLLISGAILALQAQNEKNHRIAIWLAAHAETLLQLRHATQNTQRDLNEIHHMETHKSVKVRELQLLLTLQDNLPEGTLINDLTIEDGVVKDLSGVTPAVSVLLQQIKKAPLLKNLVLKGTIAVSPEGEIFHLEGPIDLAEIRKEISK